MEESRVVKSLSAAPPPSVIPEKAGIRTCLPITDFDRAPRWIPAFDGMTVYDATQSQNAVALWDGAHRLPWGMPANSRRIYGPEIGTRRIRGKLGVSESTRRNPLAPDIIQGLPIAGDSPNRFAL